MDHAMGSIFPRCYYSVRVDGIILEMNDKAIDSFKEDGGEKLIGTNLLNCHPEPARSQLEEMLRTQRIIHIRLRSAV